MGEKMYEKFIKRFLDIAISICILPAFLVIYIVVAPIILITDGRPVFYTANRIGKDGKIYKMYKFRSMKNNAPDIRMEDGSTYNAADDPRVTKIGRILRATSIDEIPQILNVLKGDMSFIGPRPFVPVIGKKCLDKDFTDRLKVRPGITGYTQAYYRNAISQNEKIKLDAIYARKVTFINDIKILLKTIDTVVHRKNIYRA